MKKYLLKLFLFFGIVVIVDILFGMAMQYMNDHSRGGGIKSRYYVCKESNEDVLIFGSSRAKHHYVPEIFEDSLGLSCYNTGEDGNGIILSYGFLKMITQRYAPQYIVYDVSGYDIYEDDNAKYLDLMKPFYWEFGIDSIFWTISPKSQIMMFSNLYRFNTTCLRVVGNYIHPMTNYSKGYCPLNGQMNYEPSLGNTENHANEDSLKIFYFQSFMQMCKEYGIKLICFSSPSYKFNAECNYYEPIEKLCSEYDVLFYNYSADDQISSNKIYFKDRSHLNNKGAVHYTREVVRVIKSLDEKY